MQKHNMKQTSLISRYYAWWQALLAVVALMLSVCAEAGVPEVVVTNAVATSSAVAPAQPSAFEIIPEDPLAARLTFSDKTMGYENSKKIVYLKDYWIYGEWWIDENHYVGSLHESKTFSEKADNTPKVVIVDVRTGEVKDTGYVGRVQCYNEGMIATHNIGLDSLKNQAAYYGRLGESLQPYKPWFPNDMELNISSCQLVPRWKYPKPQSGESGLVARFPLKVEHGAIFLWKPKDYPELRLGQDPNNYNRLVFNRVGATVVPPLLAYWEQPSGKRVEIPLNPGEKISTVSYVPYENAYFISVDLSNTQPIKTWEPRFARLLYLDGTIKRFGVPRVIMDLLRTNSQASAGVQFDKKGLSWAVGFNSFAPDPQHLAGSYEIVGEELVKRVISGSRAVDGCRLYGSEKSLFSARRDYYYIDICKGI